MIDGMTTNILMNLYVKIKWSTAHQFFKPCDRFAQFL